MKIRTVVPAIMAIAGLFMVNQGYAEEKPRLVAKLTNPGKDPFGQVTVVWVGPGDIKERMIPAPLVKIPLSVNWTPEQDERIRYYAGFINKPVVVDKERLDNEVFNGWERNIFDYDWKIWHLKKSEITLGSRFEFGGPITAATPSQTRMARDGYQTCFPFFITIRF